MSENLKDPNAYVRERTCSARKDPRSAHELIALALTETDEERAWEAIETLRFRADREAFEAARALCRSQCPIERERGASILNQFGSPQRVFPDETLAVFLQMLPSETDSAVLESICYALSYLNHPGALKPLLSLRRHPSANVRYAVAFGLGGEDNPKAIDALIELSRDSDEDVRDWATFALGTQSDLDTPAIRTALFERLSDSDGITRGEAMVGLARRKDSRAVPAILEALNPQHLTSCFEPREDLVLEAAAEIADPRLLPALLVLEPHPDYQGLHEAVADAIGCCQKRDSS
jgi:HEAT repeat protein